MKIVNIVYSGNLECEINFERFRELGASIFSYNPKSYHGAYFQLSKGKVTLYRSGKYIIVGLKSLDDIESAFKEFFSIISKNYEIKNAQLPQIQNIVATYDFETTVDLQKIFTSSNLENMEYEPEQFSGLIFRDTDCSVLLFRSGKSVFTKAKKIDQLLKTKKKIEDLINRIE